MHTLRRQILIKSYELFDLVSMIGWFVIAVAVVAHLATHVSFSEFVGMRIKAQNFLIFMGFIFAWHVTLRAFGLYQSRRLSGRTQEAFDLLKAITLGVILLAAGGTLFRIRLATPLFLVIFWAGTYSTAILSRIALRATLGTLRKRGRNMRHLLVVGINTRSLQFVRSVLKKPDLGYHLLGFVDARQRAEGKGFGKTRYPYIGDFEVLTDYLRDSVVDEVAIFLPMKSHYHQASAIISMCEEHGIIVRLSVDLFHLKVGQSRIEQIGQVQLLTIQSGGMESMATMVKRLFDILVSSVALLMLTPLFCLTALLVRITSPGPAFFSQERIGLSKRRFRLYKFRTMVSDAEEKLADLEAFNEASGPVFKIKNDPRITPIGRFLRKMSIDELPQLFNVLKGDMSLVGPRPLPVRDYEGFDEDWHLRRFSVRPGITCLWQVNGRSNVSFHRWMTLDMEYIDNWSLGLDMKILLKTIPAVIKGSGAT
jgi:exopolysaccharide biosynthesis polyprenyl glycosylphosphotransferase